jgi:hypothetical protein
MSDGVTRRGLLALSGSVALAGCSALPAPLGGQSRTVLDGQALGAVTSAAVPTIPQSAPVDVQQSHVDAHRRRVEELLATVPTPLGADDIPNGAMREELSDAVEAATDGLSEAAAAASPLAALDTLRDARREARTVAAAWRYVDAGLRREALTGEGEALADDVAAFRNRWTYRGEDPVRAVLVHAEIESLLASVEWEGDRPGGGERPENPITVGERAAGIEHGRAALADAAHLYDRLLASADEDRDLGGAFVAAASSLVAAAEEATDDLPEGRPSSFVDADIEDTVAAHTLQHLRDNADGANYLRETRDDGRHATAVRRAHRLLAYADAFETVRQQVVEGERYPVESARDVRERRSAAIRAIETAVGESERPHLTRTTAEEFDGIVRFADREFTDPQDEVEVRWIARDVAEYVVVAAVADGLPAATETVVGALESAP